MMIEQHNFLGSEAVILTALPVECKAVLAHLQDIHEVPHPQGTLYSLGTFPGERRIWKVAVAEIGMGGSCAATETERALSFFHPQIAFFVGVAGGLKDVKIGDVVAATKVYSYEAGKAESSFQPRPEVWRTSHALEQRARTDARNNNWLRRLGESCPNPAPHAFVGALAAGEKVLVSKEASEYKLIQAVYGDALAVEMEGYGFLPSIHAHHAVHALIIRGISDLIETKAQSDASSSQEQAAQHAAAFTFEILENWVSPGTFSSIEPKSVPPDPVPPESTPTRRGSSPWSLRGILGLLVVLFLVVTLFGLIHTLVTPG